MQLQSFKKGDKIIKEGSVGTWAGIIYSGRVEVSTVINGKKRSLAILGEKQIFGEMGLIEDKPRSATVAALEDTNLSVISRESFNNLFSKDPTIILPIVKALFERLRSASKMMNTTCESCGANIGFTAKERGKATETIETHSTEDKSYIIISGVNEMSKRELGGSFLEIKGFPFKVGRYTSENIAPLADVFSNNDLSINEENLPYYVSKNHFLIDKVGGSFFVIDRGSRSGTIVNGKVIRDSCALNMKKNEIIVGSAYSPFVFDVTVKEEKESISDKRNASRKDKKIYVKIH